MKVYKSFIISPPSAQARRDEIKNIFHRIRRIGRQCLGGSVGILNSDFKVNCHHKSGRDYQIDVFLSNNLFVLFQENGIEHI